MSLFSFFFYNERLVPSMRPDKPPKNGVSRWWRVLTRNFGAFWLSGALALLGLLPWLLGLYFAIETHTLLFLLAACVGGGLLAGPFFAALTDLVFRALRDEWFSWREAWGRALKRNARESLAPGVLCCTLYGVQFFTLYHLEPGGAAMNMLVLLLAGLLAVTALTLWLWPQVVLFSMPLPRLLKNTALLALSHLGRTLAAAAAGFAYMMAVLLLNPLSFLALAALNLCFPLSAAWYILYKPLERTFDLESSIRALHEPPGKTEE